MRTVEIQVYNYNDLSVETQNKVVQNHFEMMLGMDGSIYPEDCNFMKAVNVCEENKTPWFLAEVYMNDFNGKEEIENELNEMEFLSDGSIFYEKGN